METKKTMKDALADIYKYISWGEFSVDYLGKSKAWISRKLRSAPFDGIRPTEFTEKEKEALKNNLRELANKIKETAEKI